MGCMHSRVLAVEPTEGRKSGWGAQGKPGSKSDNKSSRNNASNGRDGSALSKGTLDSGLGFEDEASAGVLPGTVPENLSSPGQKTNGLNKDLPLLSNKHGQQRERKTSSDIMEELILQGIIQSQTKVVKNGEAYDVMVETEEKPLRRPPAKLEKLKTIKEKNKSITKEDIETKMKAAEERRKTKEEELKNRLRSDRPVTALQSIRELRGEGSITPDEGQDAFTVLPVTLASATSENRMTGPLQSTREDDDGDEIDAVESDITYNNPNNVPNDEENDIF